MLGPKVAPPPALFLHSSRDYGTMKIIIGITIIIYRCDKISHRRQRTSASGPANASHPPGHCADSKGCG